MEPTVPPCPQCASRVGRSEPAGPPARRGHGPRGPLIPAVQRVGPTPDGSPGPRASTDDPALWPLPSSDRLGPHHQAGAEPRLDRIALCGRLGSSISSRSWKFGPSTVRMNRFQLVSGVTFAAQYAVRLSVLQTSLDLLLVVADRYAVPGRLPSSPSRDAGLPHRPKVSPIPTRSRGLMKPSLMRKPPARMTASRSGTAHWCSRGSDAAAESFGMSSSTSQTRLTRERLDATLCSGLRAGSGAGLETFFSFDAQSDQGADRRAELDRLILGQVAQMRDFDARLQHPCTPQSSRSREWCRSPAGAPAPSMISPWNSRVVEAEDDELNRSNCHLDPPYL